MKACEEGHAWSDWMAVKGLTFQAVTQPPQETLLHTHSVPGAGGKPHVPGQTAGPGTMRACQPKSRVCPTIPSVPSPFLYAQNDSRPQAPHVESLGCCLS